MPSRDPKSYVKAIPLPISSQKGLKLQARTSNVFNPTTPTRDEVRKWNYDRRVQQMTEQGFSACNYRPYRGIGDPIYLDDKKLILHSLGQWDENQDVETSGSSEEDEDQDVSTAIVTQVALNTAKFVLKRTKKDLNTLSKEVNKGRQLIRNVSLGHGLFDIIRQERQLKKAAVFAEKQRALEEYRSQWQPPKNSSDDDESSDDIDGDEDLENFFEAGVRDSLSEDTDLVIPSAAGSASFRSKTPSARIQSSGRKTKKKQISPRPYTPQHNSLLEISNKEDISKSALFRQLCALSWILDAMNVEQGYTMGPISTCWSHLDIGGSKVSAKKAREERRVGIDWERWLNNQQITRGSKKLSVSRQNRLSRSSRLFSHPRVSVHSRSVSPSSSSSQPVSAAQIASVPTSSQINSVAQPSSVQGSKDVILESGAVSTIDQADEETFNKTGIFKFLDEYYDSFRREEERKKEASGLSSIQDTNLSQPTLDDGSQKRNQEGKSARKSKSAQDKQLVPDKLSRSPENNPGSKFILKDLHSNLNFRSKSSAELMDFHANKFSNKYTNLRQDLQEKFKEIQDDKAMTLHDVLEQIERVRLIKCQSKFRGLHSGSLDFRWTVKEMRKEGQRALTQPGMTRPSSIRGNWYTELMVNLPSEVRDIWYYQAIMQKIGRYGLIENTSKQSVYKFLKVLEGLRHWEICNPDISAAVEFCRAKIVEMSVEEYEEWFSQAFPTFLRPKTAPAVLRDHKHGAAIQK